MIRNRVDLNNVFTVDVNQTQVANSIDRVRSISHLRKLFPCIVKPIKRVSRLGGHVANGSIGANMLHKQTWNYCRTRFRVYL